MTDGSGPITIRIDMHLEDRDIVIELGPTTQCDLVALSYLAEAIERGSAPVLVRGLSAHDRRILQYLCIELPLTTR